MAGLDWKNAPNRFNNTSIPKPDSPSGGFEGRTFLKDDNGDIYEGAPGFSPVDVWIDFDSTLILKAMFWQHDDMPDGKMSSLGDLHCVFVRDGVYCIYPNVNISEWQDLYSAGSKGSWLYWSYFVSKRQYYKVPGYESKPEPWFIAGLNNISGDQERARELTRNRLKK